MESLVVRKRKDNVTRPYCRTYHLHCLNSIRVMFVVCDMSNSPKFVHTNVILDWDELEP